MFSIDGIAQFSGLETINLSINWLSSADELSRLPHLKTLNLDSNVIQYLSLSNEAIESLSINSNPLHELILASSLKKLSAHSGVTTIYGGIALESKIDLPYMKNALTGKFLSESDFKGIPDNNNLTRLFNLTDIQFGQP